MNVPLTGGASISARTRTPSIWLSRLAELLVAALSTDDSEPVGFARYSGQRQRIRFNLATVLRRLYQFPEFKDDFAHGSDTGFLFDLESPPRGTTSKMGGRLLPGSEAKTTAALERLHQAIAREIDTVLQSAPLQSLVIPSSNQALELFARNLNVPLYPSPGIAAVVPVGFAAPSRKAAEQEKDVARVLSAIETVDGRDWLERLLKGIENYLRHEDLDNDEIQPILASIRMQRGQPGSQIQRFLDFLDDDALARVRLQVTFKSMASIATRSSDPSLKAYVDRVLACFRTYASTAGRTLPLDVSTVYGQRSCTDLSDHLRKALFYSCLPVWAEWAVQIFEARTDPEHGFATRREVSYRFRVNGKSPDSGKSAFAARLDRIEERLVEDPVINGHTGRHIAELVFLYLVIPSSLDSPGSEDIETEADGIARALKTDPLGTVKELIAKLRLREPVMERIAESLIKVLQTKSAKLVEDANRIADKFYVAVHKRIVDWAVVRTMASHNTEILVKNDQGHDHIAWFQHLVVTDNLAEVPGSLASYAVETHLMERSITPVGFRHEIRMSRDLTQPVLPVRFVPLKEEKDAAGIKQWRLADTASTSFDTGRGIDIEYDVRSLSLSKGAKDQDKATREQLRTAGCAAFTLLSYIVLLELARRAQSTEGRQRPAMYLVRLQPGGKESDATDGNAAVYAACQAIEQALSRELLVKMQGFHTQGKAETIRYRKTNSLMAMQGRFPIVTTAGGSLEKVAVLSYVTRPCDSHPLYPDAEGFLFVSRSYYGVRRKDGMAIYVGRMNSRLVENRRAFREPQLILEEIARLREQEFRHIVLLSHHFGNRHIGRAAERHAPHGTHEFLESAATKFPDVFLYPLRRDVFPATRLHTRGSNESAFEVVTFADHQRMYEESERELIRGLQPVYTFATLAVVTEEGRPQSGFCTYFFDIEQRLSNIEWSEAIRQNILGTTPEGEAVRASILGVLRGLHYLESERAATKQQVLPVLDPFGWATPATNAAAGELEVMSRRGKGSVLLSFPALLAHVTKVLHKDKTEWRS
ncbi:hypothetical protein [Methylocaldum sp. GT1BB]|jgi:hypothetical protein|uniref:hypothetical protein n=1 Tax=Methylocaldum sp. GT1BB TaxID=3438963 RepID=UPI003DA0FCF6